MKKELLKTLLTEKSNCWCLAHAEKAVYELGYEMNNRPDWIDIPLAGIEQLLHET